MPHPERQQVCPGSKRETICVVPLSEAGAVSEAQRSLGLVSTLTDGSPANVLPAAPAKVRAVMKETLKAGKE